MKNNILSFNVYIGNCIMQSCSIDIEKNTVTEFEDDTPLYYKPLCIFAKRNYDIDIHDVMCFIESRLPAENTANGTQLKLKAGFDTWDEISLLIVTEGRKSSDDLHLVFTHIPDDLSHLTPNSNLFVTTGGREKFIQNSLWYKIDSIQDQGLLESLVADVLTYSSLEKGEFINYKSTEIPKELTGYVSSVSGSESVDFVPDGMQEISLEQLWSFYDTNWSTFMHCVGRDFSLDVKTFLSKVFTLDALIFGQERNLRNMSILVDDSSSHFSPIFGFDKCLGLGIDTSKYEFDDLYLGTRCDLFPDFTMYELVKEYGLGFYLYEVDVENFVLQNPKYPAKYTTLLRQSMHELNLAFPGFLR